MRIRRDVRMRRRDHKSKEYEELDENGYPRTASRFGTPIQQVPDRPRSISNGSVQGSVHGSAHGGGDPSTPYTIDHRRSSQELGGYYNQHAYAQPPLPVQPTHAAPSYSSHQSHLTFGATSSQYAQPSFQPPPLPPAPVSQVPPRYLQGGNDYNIQPSIHTRQLSTPQSYTYSPSQSQQPSYQQTPMYPNNNTEYRPFPDHRRASLPASHQGYQSQSMSQYAQPDNRHNSLQPNYYPSPTHNPAPRSATPNSGSHVLPPIKALQPLDSRYEPYTSHSSLPASGISPVSSYESMHNKYGPSYTTTPIMATPTEYSRMGNRSHDQVFDSSDQYLSSHGGMRPGTYNHGRDIEQTETEDGSLADEYDLNHMRMLSYKRADGTRQTKKCPSPILT